MKAKFIQCIGYDENSGYRSPVYEYEYRGKKYEVVDYRNGYSVSMWQQHKYEQYEIDKVLDNKNNSKENYKSEENYEVGMDLFFKSFEED